MPQKENVLVGQRLVWSSYSMLEYMLWFGIYLHVILK